MALTQEQYLTKIEKKYGDNVPIEEQLPNKITHVIISYEKGEKFTVDDLINKFLEKTDIRLDYRRVKLGLEKLAECGSLASDGMKYWNTMIRWPYRMKK